MQGLIADSAGGSAWSFGGSILSFTFPMILTIVVLGALYLLYTKPEFVPGHHPDDWERPVSYTAVARKPATDAQAQAAPAAGTTATTATTVTSTTAATGAAAETTETAETTGTTGATSGEAPGTEDAE